MAALSDALLAEIVSLAADAIICVDGRYQITFFNDGAQRIFGWTADEVLGRPLGMLLPERFQRLHNKHVDEFGKAPVAARKMGERSVIAGVRKNGEEFPAEAAIAKALHDDGPVYSVVLRDVTAQRRAEELTTRLLAESALALKARDEVLGLVSHDLRNPVNAVKMLAGAILRVGSPEDPSALPAVVREHAEVMLRAASQMDALIQDLLDVTRLEAGKMRLNFQPIDIAEAVRTVLETLTPESKERGITLRMETMPGLPKTFADRDRIVQVMSNLVGNSVKYSPAGGSVRVTMGLEGDIVMTSVIDTGMGIAADELPYVFDRFWQSKRTNRSGAGLGLAISRGIVHAHGGEMSISSTQGKGTLVRFSLPVALATDGDEGKIVDREAV
jgi:PAS domain S-box-containing protein